MQLVSNLGCECDAAEKFGIIIPFGNFGDDLKAAFYAHIHINVRWEFAPLVAAYANDTYLEKTNLGKRIAV
jgi:hypothetical protein